MRSCLYSPSALTCSELLGQVTIESVRHPRSSLLYRLCNQDLGPCNRTDRCRHGRDETPTDPRMGNIYSIIPAHKFKFLC